LYESQSVVSFSLFTVMRELGADFVSEPIQSICQVTITGPTRFTPKMLVVGHLISLDLFSLYASLVQISN